MINKFKKTVLSIIRSERMDLATYLKNEHFYLTSYSEPQDVFVAGYPKSGNTWMQHLLASLIFGIDPQYLPDKLAQELVPSVKKNETYYKRYLPFCCFKTHRLPSPRHRKVIHLIRDGRDVMASYFAMHKAMGKNFSLEEMIINGKGLVPCKWHEHSRKWIENPYNAETIQVKYEDLIHTPKKELIKICAFIGLERSEELIEKSIKGNSFASMQKKEEKYGMNNKKWNKDEKFVRKGKIGTYNEEIPEELITYFTNESKEELTYFGYL